MNIFHKIADSAIRRIQTFGSSFPAIREWTAVEAKCPLLAVTPYGTVCKDGNLCRIVELSGKDYTGLDFRILEDLFQDRKYFFEEIPENILIMTQSIRQLVQLDANEISYSVPMSDEIAQKWNKQFETTFRTRHFLILTTAIDYDDIFKMFESAATKFTGVSDRHHKILDKAVTDTISRLEQYGPRELHGDALASFWATQLNGRPVQQKLPANGILDGVLSDSRLAWPANKDFQIYDGRVRRYSGWLSIKAPGDESTYEILTSLFSVRREVSLYQTFSRYDRDAAFRRVEDRLRNVKNFAKASEGLVGELEALQQRMQQNEVALLSHRFAVEVFGHSESDLEEALLEVRSALEAHRFRVLRESVNCEPLFWSRFPGLQNYNTRVRSITSETASHLMTAPSVGEGQQRCSFGPHPLAVFKTESGSDYAFIPHESEARYALGHTVLVGQPGKGKTTLMSFLLSQAFRFPDFRAICFDRLDGLEVATRAHDGLYITASDITSMAMNPFQMEQNVENSSFLVNWLSGLLNRSSDADQDRLAAAVMETYNLSKGDRNLKNFAAALGRSEEGNLRASLEKWLPGGAFGSFFSHDNDSLSFDTHWMTWDMTALLDNEMILSPLASYVIHRILRHSFPGGFMVFIDEAPRYFKSPIFGPYLETLLLELRKRNGVFVFATQTAESIYNSPYREAVKKGTSTYILFPDTTGEFEVYNECFGLNHAEFSWITKPYKRKVLIKRQDGPSVVLNVDLSCLGKHLRFFESSENSVKRCRQSIKEHGNAWKKHYLS